MKKILLGVVVLCGFGLLIMVMQDNGTKDMIKSNGEICTIQAREDLTLTGVVKVKNIQNLGKIQPTDLLVRNGDHVKLGQKIFKSGFLASIAGVFTFNDETAGIIDDHQFIETSFLESDKSLMTEGQEVTVTDVNDKTKTKNKITYVGQIPVEKADSPVDTLSTYPLMLDSKNRPLGQHVWVKIPQVDVIVPKAFVDAKTAQMKIPGSDKWVKFDVKTENRGGIYYAKLVDLPVDTELKV